MEGVAVMAQITESLISEYERAHAEGKHAPLTIGEEMQLIHAWKIANLQAAKPADALGSLPVVAWSDGSSVVLNRYWDQNIEKAVKLGWSPLTDHAQATAEIAKQRHLKEMTESLLRTAVELNNTESAEIAKRDAEIGVYVREYDKFTPWLKPGETPFERLERERKDNIAITGLLAKEREELTTLRAKLAGVDGLVKALHELSCLGNGYYPGNSTGNIIAQKAIATYEAAQGAVHDRQ